MTSAVTVFRPREVDDAVLERLLGKKRLPEEHAQAPVILVDGRIHLAGSRWLLRKYLYRPVDSTILSHARRLAHYIDYLRNERGLDDPDPAQADLFAAGEEDLRALYRARQFKPETAVSSDTWRAHLSTIKQVHEYLAATYQAPIPFRIATFTTPAGTTATSAVDLRPRSRTASRGLPLTTGFAELLIQGAAFIGDLVRRESHQKTAEVRRWLASLHPGSRSGPFQAGSRRLWRGRATWSAVSDRASGPAPDAS